MSLGENIRARRKQLKLSQEYVADQLGISRQAVAKWEAGKSEPSAANLAELAALFEMNLSDLTAVQDAEIQKPDAQKIRKQNARMLMARWGAVIFMNAGWDGYSSGLYGRDFPLYWLAIVMIGIVLLFITTRDMEKRHKQEPLERFLGLLLIFSIFILPSLVPSSNTGIRYLAADLVTAVCVIILNLKYWRHIWIVR